MMNLVMNNVYSEFDENENETRYVDYDIRVDDVTVGMMIVVTYDLQDGEAYCERIDIDEAFRNHGYGTQALQEMASRYYGLYLAPDNEDAQRLYERIGEEDYSFAYAEYLDQGFGFYQIYA